METFLEKLERKAEDWLKNMDSQLQQPVVQVLSGSVFTQGEVSTHDSEPAAIVPEAIEPLTTPATNPARQPIRSKRIASAG